MDNFANASPAHLEAGIIPSMVGDQAPEAPEKGLVKWFVVGSLPGKVNDMSLAPEGVQGHEAPKPAIIALVPVVPHEEIGVFGHLHRSVIVPGGLGRGDDHVIGKTGLGRLVGVAVDINLFTDDLDLIPGG